MQIESGKYYATRDGRKVGPMKHSGFDGWPWIESEGNGICWMDDGSPVDDTSSPILIAEWQDEPEHAPLDLAALAAQHRIKITVQVGDALIEYDGRS